MALVISRTPPWHWTHHLIGKGPDPSLFIWFLGWWPHALSRGLNPLTTSLIWSPPGLNLAWTTSVPGLAIPLWPITYTLGLVASYNLAIVLGLTVSALMMFVLVRTLTGAVWPSLVSGYLYAFSPFFLGHLSGGHLNWMWGPVLPFMLWVAWQRFHNRFSSRLTIILSAVAVIAQFSWSTELFATLWVMGAIGVGLSWAYLGQDVRWKPTVISIATGALLGTVATIPMIVYMLTHHGSPFGLSATAFSTSIINWFLPTRVNLGGSLVASLTRHFPANLSEQTGYIGITTMAWLIVSRKWRRVQPLRKLLAAFFLTALVLSLGPKLHGSAIPIPLPWALFSRLPILRHALPDRLMLFAFFALAILLGLYLADRTLSRSHRSLIATLVLIPLMPSLSYRPNQYFTIPPIFQNPRLVAQALPASSRVLIFPFSYAGSAMAYQALSHFSFPMAEGVTAPVPPIPYSSWPFVQAAAISATNVTCPPVTASLPQYLQTTGITRVVAVGTSRPAVARLAHELGWMPHATPGATIYILHTPPPSESTALASSQGAQTAYSLIFHAVQQYVAQGHPLHSISVRKLVAYHDYPQCLVNGGTKSPLLSIQGTFAIPEPHGRVAIGLEGTWNRLQPIVHIYGSQSISVRFPATTTPAPKHPNGQAIGFLGLVFSRSVLLHYHFPHP